MKVCQCREIRDFGKTLRTKREADGRSVQLLATEVGIASNYWYQLEGDKRSWVSGVIVKKIEKVLGFQFTVEEEESD